MSAMRQARTMDQIARDLDLVVYRLEQAAPQDPEAQLRERDRLRRELEGLRDRIDDVVRALDL